MNEDVQLLSRYAEERSEAAFAEFVRRQVNFVHAAALRRVGGDAQLAEEVTQQVFTALAREAKTLARHPVLCGWMFTATKRVAARAVRTERRRRAREQVAFIMNETNPAEGSQPDWEQLRPELDAVLDQLGEGDRAAVLLRFFEGRTFGEVGARLRLTENAARMRVERALDKMHAALASRGVGSTAAALGLALTAQAGIVAPAGIAVTVAGAALAGAAASGEAALVLTFMSMTKLQLGIAGAVVALGVGGVAVQMKANAGLRDELAGLRGEGRDVAGLRAVNEQLRRGASEVAVLKRDDAELARLSEEAAALTAQAQTLAVKLPSRPTTPAVGKVTGIVFTADQIDQQPKPMFKALPVYPAAFRSAGLEGKALVKFVVDANGKVHDAKAVSFTHPEFEAAAVAAVSKWEFSAGQKEGRAVNTSLQIPIVFTLSKPGTTKTTTGDWF